MIGSGRSKREATRICILTRAMVRQARKMPIQQFSLPAVLEELEMSQEVPLT